MIYYFIFIVLVLFFSIELYASYRNKRIGKGMYWSVALLLTLLAALRSNIGVDYKSYNDMFTYINLNWYGRGSVEPGYYWLNQLLPTYHTMLFVIAIIFLPIKFYVIKQRAQLMFLSLLLYYTMYFFSYDMGMLRQSIALAFTLYSIRYIEERQLWKFLSCILVASLFHTTALIFAISYWIARKNFSYILILVITACTFVLAFTPLGSYLFVGLVQIANGYANYIDSEYMEGVFNLNMIKRFLLVIFFGWFILNQKTKIQSEVMLFNLYCIGTWLYYIFKPAALLSARLSSYFNILEIFLWGIILMKVKHRVLKAALIVIVILYCTIEFIPTLSKEETENNLPYVPYHSVLHDVLQ